ncbi:MAG: FliH/SctL family protein, partial [Pseudomonadota bacterium]|nr:FliH/SctL family protein [Pseudomonadota bacterium]
MDFDDLEILKEINEQEQEKEEDHSRQDAEPEEDIITFTEEEMNSQRQLAREEGRNQGVTETLEGIENTIAHLFDKIEKTLSGLHAIQIEENARTHKEAISVASAMVEKLFSNLDKEHGFEEVVKLTEDTLEGLLREPSVIIHVDAAYAGIMDERLTEYLSRRDFEGKVSVSGDAHMAAGDCRIEWATGSTERSSRVTLEAVKEVVEHNLNATQPASPLTSGSSELVQAVSGISEPTSEIDDQQSKTE